MPCIVQKASAVGVTLPLFKKNAGANAPAISDNYRV